MFQRGVSLYSFQEKYYRGEMNLRDCLATAAGFGVSGFEMLPDQMLPGYPSIVYNLDTNFVAQWKDWIAEYNIWPIAFDIYGETKLRKGQITRDDDLFAELIELAKTANTLGFSILRLPFHVPFRVSERLVPYCADHGMKIASEIHTPYHLDGERAQQMIELAVKRGDGTVGLMPDLGIFCARIPQQVLQDSLRRGGSPEITDYLARLYHTNDREDLIARVAAMGGNEIDQWLAMRLQIDVWSDDDPRLLKTCAPYIIHIHGKFYQMNDDLEENDVRYPQIMQSLIEAGYQGYIMSEYEGQRLIHGADMGYDEIEQVRRHQAMLAHYQKSEGHKTAGDVY